MYENECLLYKVKWISIFFWKAAQEFLLNVIIALSSAHPITLKNVILEFKSEYARTYIDTLLLNLYWVSVFICLAISNEQQILTNFKRTTEYAFLLTYKSQQNIHFPKLIQPRILSVNNSLVKKMIFFKKRENLSQHNEFLRTRQSITYKWIAFCSLDSIILLNWKSKTLIVFAKDNIYFIMNTIIVHQWKIFIWEKWK